MSKKTKPTRREFIKTTGAAALGSAAGFAGIPLATNANEPGASRKYRPSQITRRRPNILFMMVDEMRYPPVYEGAGLAQFRQNYLHFQNQIRANGVEFHRHYAASMACAPSRASLFTGHYPSLHGVTQTTGAAKAANDPDIFWLEQNSVPTMGDYFKAAGYRSLYRGKWHASNADLEIPGTNRQVVSFDDTGQRDLEKEYLYQQANQLGGYGFDGWIGPEPHGRAPLNTASSPPKGQRGRDQGFAEQSVELLQELDASSDNSPWLMVSSFVNPHDIALWGFFARNSGFFNFDIEELVPGFDQLFDAAQFSQSILDDLSTKPSCQESYQTSYSEWMQAIPPRDYFRFYYQLHKNVDEEMGKVYQALQNTRFFENTIVVFTSDHGDLLGSHRYMHQKWYQAYDEALRVPLIISYPRLLRNRLDVDKPTSHVDLLPTLLAMARLNPDELLPDISDGNSDLLPLVGRDLLTPIISGGVDALNEPIFFMTDDDPSRGLDQDNFYGVAYDSVTQPNSIETVIVELDGELWKYSRYFDNPQFWSDPSPLFGPPKDSVVTVSDGLIDIPGEFPVDATERVKFQPEPEEFEMYNVTQDPMELDNLYDRPGFGTIQQQLAQLLDEQREQKRLRPVSGEVPGQP